MKRMVYARIGQSKKQPVRWDMCQIFPEVGPFEYTVYEKNIP